jgi:hypothetical protein
MMDAADIVVGNSNGITGKPSQIGFAPYHALLCRNDDGSDLLTGYPVKKKAIVVPSDDQLGENLNQRSFDVLTTPTFSVEGAYASPEKFVDFGIVLAPIKPDEFGLVAFSGVVGACVMFTDETDKFKFVRGGDRRCHASPYGNARILHRTKKPLNTKLAGSPWFEFCYINLSVSTYSTTAIGVLEGGNWSLGELATVSILYPMPELAELPDWPFPNQQATARNDMYSQITSGSRVSLRIGEDGVWQVIAAGAPLVAREQINPAIPLTGSWE